MTDPNEIVGHKTFRDDEGGFRHEPLTRAEADAVHAAAKEAEAKRAEMMPDSQAALRTLTDAIHRLKELGWRHANYCPKDGSEFELIEAGSSGISRGYWSYHNGRDGAGCVWIPADGDLWPSHPILYRTIPTTDDDEQGST